MQDTPTTIPTAASKRQQEPAVELSEGSPADQVATVQDSPPDALAASAELQERVQLARAEQLRRDERTDPARRGSKTSEFKLTLVTWVASALVFVVGLIFPDVPTDSLTDVLVWLAGLLVMGGSAAAYTGSRTRVKTKILEAARQVQP